MSEVKTKKPLFHISYEATQLIEVLRSAEVGELITYERMNKKIAGDVQRSHRSALNTARRHLLREDQAHFGTVIGVGIKRLNEHEATQSLDLDVSKIRSGARRVNTKTQLINIAPLTPSERAKLAMVQTLSSVIERSTTGRSQQRLLEAGEGVSLKQAFAALSGE